MRVSVIIPTYNHGDFVATAIHSALAQTVRDIEVVVVDNFSTDNTEQVVRAIDDPRLRYYRFNNGGIIAAGRNFGVARSTGDFIAFLDSDDHWALDKLEQQLPHFSFQGVVCVGSNYEPIGDTQNTRKLLKFDGTVEWRSFNYRDFLLGNPMMLSSAILRRTDFERLGGFDPNPDYAFFEDWELWLRLARTGIVRILPTPLLYYRVVRKKSRNKCAIAANHFKLLSRHRALGLLPQEDYRHAFGNLSLDAGRAYLDAGDWMALRMYWNGFRFAVGWEQRLRGICGLLLTFLPPFGRGALLKLYYRVYANS